MTRIALLGANGMFGKDAVPFFRAAGEEVYGGDLPNVDITSPSSLAAFLDAHPCDVVLNAAAYTNVDGAETQREEAMRINGLGPKVVAEACLDRGLLLLHISTDYVFPGEKPEGYLPNDPTGPAINGYGESKLLGERAVREILPDSQLLVCRTQWLYGRHGTNFIDTIRGLALTRSSLRVVDDQWGVPTHTLELARQMHACLEAGARGIVHTVGGGGPVTWYEVAREVVALSGLPCTVSPCTSEEFPRPARRPHHAWLRHKGDWATGDWKDTLASYLRSRTT